MHWIQQGIMLDRNALGLVYLFMLWAFADANIALRKPTKLSSTFDPLNHEGVYYKCCNSTFADDGIRAVLLTHGEFICAHSESEANEQSWWAVDLQNVYVINAVDIFGRTDCCTEDLVNFDVEIILSACTYTDWNNLEEGCTINLQYNETISQRFKVTIPPKTKGRYIRIKRRDTLRLVICEVEVYGNPINSIDESGLARSDTNYACGKMGYGYVGPVIGTPLAKSSIHCTVMCFINTACSAVEYERYTSVCTLKGECYNGTQSSLYPNNNKRVFLIG